VLDPIERKERSHTPVANKKGIDFSGLNKSADLTSSLVASANVSYDTGVKNNLPKTPNNKGGDIMRELFTGQAQGKIGIPRQPIK
jgi:hypothetical protein